MNEDDLKEFGTLSGYLCSQAGEIPAVGDYVVVGGYMFTVTKVGRSFYIARVLAVSCARVIKHNMATQIDCCRDLAAFRGPRPSWEGFCAISVPRSDSAFTFST